MRSRFFCASLGATAFFGLAYQAYAAPNFIVEVPSDLYVSGNVFIASGDSYNDTSAVLGSPAAVVAPSKAWAGALTPFNPHYENTQLTAIGTGGTITMRFSYPVLVHSSTKVAIYTSAGFSDMNYPLGMTGSSGHTSVHDEYGAERTAIVEVADGSGNFISLGRQIFDDPTNYFTNVNDPFQFPTPAEPEHADFAKPFQPSTSLANKTLAELLTLLDGSAGGTWIDVPDNIGISEITQIRISDTMWSLDNGDLVSQRTSIYDNSYIKPADLFISAAVAIPEPAAIGLLGITGLFIGIRRRKSDSMK